MLHEQVPEMQPLADCPYLALAGFHDLQEPRCLLRQRAYLQPAAVYQLQLVYQKKMDGE